MVCACLRQTGRVTAAKTKGDQNKTSLPASKVTRMMRNKFVIIVAQIIRTLLALQQFFAFILYEENFGLRLPPPAPEAENEPGAFLLTGYHDFRHQTIAIMAAPATGEEDHLKDKTRFPKIHLPEDGDDWEMPEDVSEFTPHIFKNLAIQSRRIWKRRAYYKRFATDRLPLFLSASKQKDWFIFA